MSDFNIVIEENPTNVHIDIDPDIDQTNINIDTQQAPVQSVNGKVGFVHIDKNDVGLSNVENISITGVSGYLQYQINNIDGSTLTGIDLSAYYLKSNPSGFITGVDLSSYVTKLNGQFTNRPQVNGTGVLLQGEATQGTIPENIVYTTGDQTVNGAKQFVGFPLRFGNSSRIDVDEEFLRIRGTNGNEVLSTEEYLLFDANNKASVGFDSRILYNSNNFNNQILDWSGPYLQFFGNMPPTFNGTGLALVGAYNVTYNHLRNLKNSGLLDIGRVYKITDFILKWRLDSVNTDQILSGSGIEPLYVSAISRNKINEIAYSDLYPNDVIYYDIDATGCKTWGVNSQKSIPDFKGWIYRRINKVKNIDISWDWRNIKINCCKLDLSSIPNYDFNAEYIYEDLVKYNGNLYFLNTGYSQGVAPISDPVVEATSLILHMDGTSFGQNFSDSSINNLPVYRFGDTYTSTNVKKIGNASARFDGNGDYLIVSGLTYNPSAGYTNKFNFSNKDFTIEYWLHPLSDNNINNLNRTGTISVFSQGGSIGWFNGNPGLYFGLSKSQFAGEYLLQFGAKTGNNFKLFTGDPMRVDINNWNHIACVRKGTGVNIYVNGQIQNIYNFSNASIEYCTALNIGGYNGAFFGGPILYHFLGFIDEFRIITGIAYYTGNFTPTLAPFPDAQNTSTILSSSSNRWKSLLPNMPGVPDVDYYLPTNESMPFNVLGEYGNNDDSYTIYKIPFNTGSRKQLYTFIDSIYDSGLSINYVNNIKINNGVSSLFYDINQYGFNNNEINFSAYGLFFGGMLWNKINDTYQSIFGPGFNYNSVQNTRYVIFQDNVSNNYFYRDLIYTFIGNDCSNNEIYSEIAGTVITDNFSNNIIKTKSSFLYNFIKDNFINNTINCENMQYNYFGNNTISNIINNNFYDNFINNNFSLNKIYDKFEDNQIDDNVKNNIFNNSFFYNEIYGSFQNNIVDTSLSNNVFPFFISAHVYNEYNTRIFKNSNNVNRLSYYGPNDQLIVTDINA